MRFARNENCHDSQEMRGMAALFPLYASSDVQYVLINRPS
jgi:hypothetical protein